MSIADFVARCNESWCRVQTLPGGPWCAEHARERAEMVAPVLADPRHTYRITCLSCGRGCGPDGKEYVNMTKGNAAHLWLLISVKRHRCRACRGAITMVADIEGVGTTARRYGR